MLYGSTISSFRRQPAPQPQHRRVTNLEVAWRITVYCGLLLFCLACWAVFFAGCSALGR